MDAGGVVTVWTVGHGARPIEGFLAVVREAAVEVLVDIRRYPVSRRHPQFGRDALGSALSTVDIRYEWQGDALGGRRSRVRDSRHTALRNAAFQGYADHMDGDAFRTAVDALVARSATARVAVMCAETPWWQCHRMLVADALTMRGGMRGSNVVHLLELGRSQPHRPHPTVRRGPDGWPIYDVPDTLPGL